MEDEKDKPRPKYPIWGSEEIMSRKAHGTTRKPVQENLRYGVDIELANKVCSLNRNWDPDSGFYNENLGYCFQEPRTWLKESLTDNPLTYYDSVTGKPLFLAPVSRSTEDFVKECHFHGKLSFRDPEVVWEHVRCLKTGEVVSVDGTHLGHNVIDHKGYNCS